VRAEIDIVMLRSCCFCVDHGEGVKVVGIVSALLTAFMCLEQVLALYLPGIFFHFTLFLSSALLVHGAASKRRAFVLPWVVAVGVACLIVAFLEVKECVESGQYEGLLALTLAGT